MREFETYHKSMQLIDKKHYKSILVCWAADSCLRETDEDNSTHLFKWIRPLNSDLLILY
jgi:hypothetical protein